MIMFWPLPLFGGIFSILLFIFIIAMIVRIAIWGGHRHHHWHDYYHDESKSSALNILQERYAKGEITKEQYESMKKDLGY
jgi:putative membrane protein